MRYMGYSVEVACQYFGKSRQGYYDRLRFGMHKFVREFFVKFVRFAMIYRKVVVGNFITFLTRAI